MAMVKISRSEALRLFEALGIKTAPSWSDEKMGKNLNRINRMEGLDEVDLEEEDPKSDKLLEKILSAIDEKNTIVVVPDAAGTKPPKGKKAPEPEEEDEETDETDDEDAEDSDEDSSDDDGDDDEESEESDDEDEDEPAPKKGKKKPVVAADDDEEEEESEDEDSDDDEEESEDSDSDEDESEEDEEEDESDDDDDEEEPVTTKKKTAEKPAAGKGKTPAKPPTKTKPDAPKGKGGKAPEKKAPPKQKKEPGVIDHIIKCLVEANKNTPVTKDKIVKVLVEKFPDRDEKAMRSTVNSQIPSGLRAEKAVEVKSNETGYWLDKPPANWQWRGGDKPLLRVKTKK